MKHYKIYEHPAGRIEAVKLGWSWPAFFFAPTWALFKKMWGLGGGVLAAYLFSVFLLPEEEAGNSLLILVETALHIIFAVNGNRWRENNLQSRGYEYKETQTAAHPEGAVALYLRHKSNTPVQT